MQKKYAKDGLIVVMVDIDPQFKRDSLGRIEEKVRKLVMQHDLGAIRQLILDVPGDEIEEKLRVDSTPAAYVFSRDGKWRQFAGEEGANHKAIEELVVKLLAAK
jgi:hypothetical protein